MKLNRKKIIAREFLLLMVCIFISVIAFVGIYPYNHVIKSKVDKIEKKIIPLANELQEIEEPINAKLSKQKWFYEKWQENSNLVDYKNYSEIWEKLEYLHSKDSIKVKWNSVWAEPVLNLIKSLDFKNPTQFDKFIEDNSLNRDELDKIQVADNIRSEISDYKNQIESINYNLLDIDDQFNFALFILVIAGIIAFPIRYLYYSVRWSIKTLKQTE